MSGKVPPSGGGGKLLRFRGQLHAHGQDAADGPVTTPASTSPGQAQPETRAHAAGPGSGSGDASANDVVFTGWHPGPFATESLLPSTAEASGSSMSANSVADGEPPGNVVSLTSRSGIDGRRAGQHPPRTITLLGGLVRFKAAIAVTAAAVGLGGLGAAAYTGSLPDPAQELAHSALGARAPQIRAAAPGRTEPLAVPGTPRHRQQRMAAAPPTSATPPDVGSPAAYGLCRAFDRAIEQGDDVSTAVAFRRLARAAGGASKVQAFCAAVPGPGAPASGPASAPASAPAPGSATASGSPTTGAQVPETASGTQGLTDGQTLRETESSDPATRTGTPTSGVSTSAGTAPASPGTTSLQAEPTSTTVETTPTGGSPNTTPGRRETTGAPEGTRSLSTRQGRLGLQPYTFSVWVADVTEWATADPDSYPGDSVRAATVTPERSTGYSATGTRGVF